MTFGNRHIQPLLSLGLTDLEARIYIFLLSANPATGYRIARAVGKPAANIYEAIRSLEEKGALVVDEGKKRLCSPVPLKQFLSQVRRHLENQINLAETNLEHIRRDTDDKRIYQIRSIEQVLERSRNIINTARVVTLVDAFPQILEPLISHIEASARKGVEVFVKSYKPVKIRGAKTTCDPRGSFLLSVYPGDWLRIVADGHEHLLAYLTDQCRRVSNAVWSASSFTSLMEHFDMWTEFHMARLAIAVETGSNQNVIRRILAEHRRSRRERLPGYKMLVGRFGIKAGEKSKSGE